MDVVERSWFDELVETVGTSVGSVIGLKLDALKPKEFVDTAERDTSEFFFGYVEIRSQFQKDVVTTYAPMYPILGKITSPESVAILLETAYAIQAFCRRWDKLSSDGAKGFQEKQVKSMMQNLREFVMWEAARDS